MFTVKSQLQILGLPENLVDLVINSPDLKMLRKVKREIQIQKDLGALLSTPTKENIEIIRRLLASYSLKKEMENKSGEYYYSPLPKERYNTTQKGRVWLRQLNNNCQPLYVVREVVEENENSAIRIRWRVGTDYTLENTIPIFSVIVHGKNDYTLKMEKTINEEYQKEFINILPYLCFHQNKGFKLNITMPPEVALLREPSFLVTIKALQKILKENVVINEEQYKNATDGSTPWDLIRHFEKTLGDNVEKWPKTTKAICQHFNIKNPGLKELIRMSPDIKAYKKYAIDRTITTILEKTSLAKEDETYTEKCARFAYIKRAYYLTCIYATKHGKWPTLFPNRGPFEKIRKQYKAVLENLLENHEQELNLQLKYATNSRENCFYIYLDDGRFTYATVQISPNLETQLKLDHSPMSHVILGNFIRQEYIKEWVSLCLDVSKDVDVWGIGHNPWKKEGNIEYVVSTAAEGLYRAFIYNDCHAWVNKYLSVDLTQCDGREILKELFVKGCQEWLAQQK